MNGACARREEETARVVRREAQRRDRRFNRSDGSRKFPDFGFLISDLSCELTADS
jgi:hypothetical protein